jgi:hypothetical protein
LKERESKSGIYLASYSTEEKVRGRKPKKSEMYSKMLEIFDATLRKIKGIKENQVNEKQRPSKRKRNDNYMKELLRGMRRVFRDIVNLGFRKATY